MAVLHSELRAQRQELSAHHVVGRSRRCELVLDRAEVSSQHAVLRWTPQGWELRDLGSRNGTFVNGEAIEGWVLLGVGAELSFGHVKEVWVLRSAAPPRASAEQDGGPLVIGETNLLALPSPEDPRATFFVDAQGCWVMETSDALSPVQDGETVELGGGRWTLSLPAQVEPTLEQSARLRLSELTLEFAVSADEEYVELAARAGTQRLDLGARSSHYMLLTLARVQLDEADVAPKERGWIDKQRLGRMLRLDELQLNLQIFRARKQLREAEVEDAPHLIERRVGTGQLRLAPLPVVVRRS